MEAVVPVDVGGDGDVLMAEVPEGEKAGGELKDLIYTWTMPNCSHKPIPLLGCSRKMAAIIVANSSETSVTWMMENVPTLILEEIVCELGADQLVEVVDYLGGNFVHVRNEFTENGFQKFWMRFLMELERSGVRKETRIQMRNMLQDYETFLQLPLTRSNLEMSMACNVTSMMLGMFTIVLPAPLANTYRFKFFAYKLTNNSFASLVLPNPKIPLQLRLELREEEKKTKKQKWFSKRETIVEEEKCPPMPIPWTMFRVNQFFMMLLAMLVTVQRARSFETIAYAADLLYRDDYLSNNDLKWFYLHIWGMLSVALSRLNRPKIVTFSCLEQMKKYARFESDRLEMLLYRQKVYSSYHGEWKNEKLCHLEIMASVPGCSFFYRKSILIHTRTKLRNIEDLIALTWCLGKVEKYDDGFIEKGLNKISKLERQLHLFSSNPSSKQSFIERLSVYMDTLELFRLALKHLKVTIDHPERVYHSGAEIQKASAMQRNDNAKYHMLGFFLDIYNEDDNFTFGEYRQNMMTSKDNLEKKARRQNVVTWGHTEFTHFLLMTVLAGYTLEGEHRLDLAKEIYMHNQHPRLILADLCSFVFKNKLKSIQVVKKEEPSPVRVVEDIDMKWMIVFDPEIKTMIVKGIESNQQNK